MAFISYAQNQEDVMLCRALGDVKQGFYIDVGAQDPVADSVTKAFYDRGWHGINIEPSAEYFQKLESERPHDTNLPTAVGRGPGIVTFYEVMHTGLSTTNASYAERYSEAGYEVQRREVPCTTLDRICTENSVSTVHFLKIDVEGAEREVLEGCSFEVVRPWLVVVESTAPNSEREIFSEWEDLLLRRSYRFVYFDGLNRFYAAEEHADLARHFSRPPNLFDQYVTYQLWRTRTDLETVVAAQRDALTAERNALVNSLNHMLAEVQNARAESLSYRAESQTHLDKAQTLQEALAELHRQLGSLLATLAERDRQLGNLQGMIAERDWQLGSLHEAMVQRDQQLAGLQTTMVERDRQLTGLQINLAKAHRRLDSLRSSVSWKITSPLRETRRAAVRIIGLFRRPKSSSSNLGTAAFASADLAMPDELDAGLTEPARVLYHNLREAMLPRRTEGKPLSGEERS
jgi:FkbM family methyltransferase